MKDTSVLIVTSKRPAKLKRLLESILKFAVPEAVEVNILINGEDSQTEVMLNELIPLHRNIRYFKSSTLNRGEARNILINKSDGKILYFLDDDVLIKNDVFSLINKKFEVFSDISILGGPNLTMPGSSLFQECQGHALASFFGTLWISRRYKKNGSDRMVDESGLILCNLAVKKEIFDQTNMRFPVDFISAEENLLLARFARLGYSAMYIPQLEVFHERRSAYGDFFRQIVTYGKGRAQIFRAFPSYVNPVYFLPALFVFYLLGAIFIKSYIYSIPLLIYLALDLLFSLKISFEEKDIYLFPTLLFIFPTIHFAYASGFLAEITKKRKGSNDARLD